MGRKKEENLCTFYVSIPKEVKSEFDKHCESNGLIKGFVIAKLISKFLSNPNEFLK